MHSTNRFLIVMTLVYFFEGYEPDARNSGSQSWLGSPGACGGNRRVPFTIHLESSAMSDVSATEFVSFN